MTNTIGTAACAICIVAVEYFPLPSLVALPLFIAFGLMLGYFATRMRKKGRWH